MKSNLLRVTLAALVLSSLIAFAGDKKEEHQSATLNFTITKDSNGKPVKYASVILHTLDKNGKQDKGSVQLKTSEEGKTSAPGVPFGKVRVQVIAKGYQTWGEDIDVNKSEQEIAIKMKPPAEQFSIYK